MRKKPVIRRWRQRNDLQANRLQVYPQLFAVRVPKALDVVVDWGENLHWCPLCTAEMFEGYGSYSIYSQIIAEWGSIQDFHQAMRETEFASSQTGESLEEKWSNSFDNEYDEPPQDNDDVVLFFSCSGCDFITPASEYADAVRNYSDWYD
ncbi:MAG: hypothetical protein ABI690_30780 [Chloroflexota bacterium]